MAMFLQKGDFWAFGFRAFILGLFCLRERVDRGDGRVGFQPWTLRLRCKRLNSELLLSVCLTLNCMHIVKFTADINHSKESLFLKRYAKITNSCIQKY